jgi:hypothetical protein
MSIVQMNAATVGRRTAGAASSTFVEATISLVAGRGVAGYLGDGGPATAANLQYPTGVALDHDGNVFIADAANHRIRRIDPDGTITAVAGTGGTGGAGFAGDGGPATEAKLHKPTGVAVSRKGELFIADEYNHRIRRVGTHGRISTVAGASYIPPCTTDWCLATTAATAGRPPRPSSTFPPRSFSTGSRTS